MALEKFYFVKFERVNTSEFSTIILRKARSSFGLLDLLDKFQSLFTSSADENIRLSVILLGVLLIDPAVSAPNRRLTVCDLVPKTGRRDREKFICLSFVMHATENSLR